MVLTNFFSQISLATKSITRDRSHFQYRSSAKHALPECFLLTRPDASSQLGQINHRELNDGFGLFLALVLQWLQLSEINYSKIYQTLQNLYIYYSLYTSQSIKVQELSITLFGVVPKKIISKMVLVLRWTIFFKMK